MNIPKLGPLEEWKLNARLFVAVIAMMLAALPAVGQTGFFHEPPRDHRLKRNNSTKPACWQPAGMGFSFCR